MDEHIGFLLGTLIGAKNRKVKNLCELQQHVKNAFVWDEDPHYINIKAAILQQQAKDFKTKKVAETVNQKQVNLDDVKQFINKAFTSEIKKSSLKKVALGPVETAVLGGLGTLPNFLFPLILLSGGLGVTGHYLGKIMDEDNVEILKLRAQKEEFENAINDIKRKETVKQLKEQNKLQNKANEQGYF